MIQLVWFGMLWLCLILQSYYMLIDLTFFYFTNRKHQYLAHELSKQFQLSVMQHKSEDKLISSVLAKCCT